MGVSLLERQKRRLAGWFGSGAGAVSNLNSPSVAERLGYPANARLLVIHSDDFGMNRSVNRAIAEALEQGWINSSSMMVPCPGLAEAALWARAHPEADLGIHLTLNAEWTAYRWGPVSSQPAGSKLRDADGYLPKDKKYVRQADPRDVEAELRAQVEQALGAGVKPSHLDSHMGALFSTQALFDVYLRVGGEYKIPMLLHKDPVVAKNARLPAGFNTDAVVIDKVLQISEDVGKEQWRAAYEKMLAPLGPGTYELIVHLAYDDEEMRAASLGHAGWGAGWRQNDLDVMKSGEFQKFLKDQKFVLVTWKELARTMPEFA